MNILHPKYIQTTPKASLNFVGAVHRYFDAINSSNLEKTNDIYIEIYNNAIFPYINYGKALDDYDIEYVEDLIELIKQENDYKESTVRSTIRHLLYDPCKYYFREYHPNDNTFEINPSDFRGLKDEDKESVELRIIKSLTASEELKAGKILFSDPKQSGEMIGLAIMFFTASRNNETCGYNFGDLLELQSHPGCYYLQITKSTEIKSNRLKAGGKTYNAFRRLPLVETLSDFLFDRIQYLEHELSFPYEENGITYNSVYDLPIACRGHNYGERCSSDDLTRAGRTLLRESVGMTKSRIAGIQLCILEDRNSEYDLGEKDVTTYLLRRNMATHLYTLGFSTLESQYYMGHKMEGTALKRSDFGDETFLYKLWKMLQYHPLNSYESIENLREGSVHNTSKVIVQVEKDSIVKIENKEYGDVIQLNIRDNHDVIKILETSLYSENNEEVNVLNKLIKLYINR